ncbi:Peptidase [Wenxinia marina DSM 24838]|uniref:Peptidase n=1 Tax=Wenxinia marina DSM 24838 TaxID=1123501 RepID=A0A0D0QEA6_9RHOB|nr:Peptidase [Wenxinia marina DSM 24838]
MVRLTVDLRQGGHAITAGGSRFLILSAGYLGSLLIGAAIFLAAHRGRSDRAVLAGLGVLLGGVALWAVRDMIGFALCAAAALAMLAAARFLPVAAADLILRLIGLTSLIYVPLDIFDDTLRRSGEISDARLLATEIGGATVVWGALWLAVSLVVIALTLRAGLGRGRG